eukprot:7893911-Ditylum_brightwellii.AAC.1
MPLSEHSSMPSLKPSLVMSSLDEGATPPFHLKHLNHVMVKAREENLQLCDSNDSIVLVFLLLLFCF